MDSFILACFKLFLDCSLQFLCHLLANSFKVRCTMKSLLLKYSVGSISDCSLCVLHACTNRTVNAGQGTQIHKLLIAVLQE